MTPRVQQDRLRSGSSLSSRANLTGRVTQRTQVASQTGDNQLAAALASFNPALQKFMQNRQDEQIEKDQDQALVDFQNHRTSYNEAIKEGLIPAGASPHYRRAYQAQELRIKGMEYDAALREAYAANEVRNADDPMALSKFVAEFSQEWAAENLAGYDNESVADAFSPAMARSESNLFTQHQNTRNAAIEQAFRVNTGIEIGKAIDAGRDSQNSVTDIAVHIQAVMNSNTEHGMLNAEVNEVVTQAVLKKALVERDASVLEVLSHVKAGDHVLSDRPAVQAQIDQIEEQIAAEQAEEVRLHKAKETERRKLAKESIYAQAFDAVVQDPTADLTPYLQQLRDEGLTSSISEIKSIRDAFLNNTEAMAPEDPIVVSDLYTQIMNGQASTATIGALIRHGSIHQDTAIQAFNFLNRINSQGGKTRLQHPDFKELVRNLKQSFMSEEGEPSPDAMSKFIGYRRRLTNYYLDQLEQGSQDAAIQATEERLMHFLKQVDNAAAGNHAEFNQNVFDPAEEKLGAPSPFAIEQLRQHKDNPEVIAKFKERFPSYDPNQYLGDS